MDKEIKFCSYCGLPLDENGECKRQHEKPKRERIGKYSGFSSFRAKNGYAQ